MNEEYTIYEHSMAKDGKSATEISPVIGSETTPHEAVDQKIAIDKERSKMTYDAMIKNANEILFAAKTVFPFTLFPTSIVIDRMQVNIEVGMFFGVKNYHSFLIKDVSNIQVTSGVLFSQVHFEVTGYEKNPADINYLKNKDAEQIKKIIDGIHLAQAAQIDITQLDKSEVLNLARKTTYRNNFNNAPI